MAVEAGAQRTGVGSRRLGCTVRGGEAHRKFSALSVPSLQSRGVGGGFNFPATRVRGYCEVSGEQGFSEGLCSARKYIGGHF